MSHAAPISSGTPPAETIVVAMSGGVDSSVAAALLARQGHPVIGVTLQMWSGADAEDDRVANTCRACHAIVDAREVAARLGIPHHVLEAGAEFEREVADPFSRAYLQGRTPNPCLPCNARLKFGALLRQARAWGAMRLATGHYARRDRDSATGRHLLRRARDLHKDQSYFLSSLDQTQLAAALFPLGDLEKADTRRIAAELGLPVAEKPESQQVCFAAGDYRAYLRQRAAGLFAPGVIRDVDGTPLGRHGGLALYTVGQRHGLGLGSPRPYYVVRLDTARNEVIVGGAEDLDVSEVELEALNLIALPDLPDARSVLAKVRSTGPAVPATLWPPHQGRARLAFRAPQRAVAPGQAAVLYDAEDPDLVLAGGTITSRKAH
ncbi:MAG: tRNA 2-thiouridine(34) synthase MnmA [candidate division NC10 bacterium]|nr:tRNA 2-thiouridine(34) synthase MnmA [candidate division NC10 bacterium]